MDMSIAIRTCVIRENKVYVQAGAGLVADSNPESEWNETQIKARAVIKAVELSSNGLILWVFEVFFEKNTCKDSEFC